MIKFSVLIPTRNRLQYLKFAIDSVLQQNYENWEIIISDNCSEEDIESYVKSLSDERIQYYRTSSFIPVTDNWNNALEKSSGDYVIMLGDDDGLMHGYFSTALNLINQFDSPDFLYTSAFLYAYPNVLQDFPKGLLHKWGNAEFLEGKTDPFILEKNIAIETVKRSLNFKVLFNFNVQFDLVARSLINELQKYGKFYQSPYPDYYSTIVLLLKAKKILAVPYPLTIVGITPKSFGYYYFNNKEKIGLDFLKNYPDESVLPSIQKYVMPGSNMNTSWLLALETVRKNFGEEFNLKVNYKNYRILQMLYHFKHYATEKNIGSKDIRNMAASLFWWEKIMYLFPFMVLSQLLRKCSKIKNRDRYIDKIVTSFSHPQFMMKRVEGNFYNISEVIQHLSLNYETK